MSARRKSRNWQAALAGFSVEGIDEPSQRFFEGWIAKVVVPRPTQGLCYQTIMIKRQGV